MTYLEFGEKKTEMDETENTIAEILDDLINSALDKIFQGRNFFVFWFENEYFKTENDFRFESRSKSESGKNKIMAQGSNRQYE